MFDQPNSAWAAPSRRRFLTASMLGAGGLLLPAMVRSAQAGVDFQFASSIRSLSNAFHTSWDKGGQAYAGSVGASYSTLVTEGNSEKGIADIKTLLAKTGGKLVLGVDPNDSPDARPIVEAVAKAGGYVVTVWNKPDDLHPWDFGDNYVAHMSFNGVPAGEQTAEALFASFGGEGGIVGLGGIASNAPAIQRKQGLMNTLKTHGKVELLDFQDADWDSTKASNVVSAWITRFGSKIKGVWAANDGMAIGALEALRAEGLAGKVLVTGVDGTKDAVSAIRAKEMAATVDWNPFWIGGMALSLGYHAASGAFSPAKEPKAHREFYGSGVLVTAANVEAFWKSNVEAAPKADWNDLWGKVTGQITY